jgi:hypothetical protein
MARVLYEDSPKYDLWLKIVLAIAPSLMYRSRSFNSSQIMHEVSESLQTVT